MKYSYKNDYLMSQSIVSFLSWLTPLLDTPQSFLHSYTQKKPKRYLRFDNLYSAYEQYDWSLSGEISDLSVVLAKAIEQRNEQDCERTCYEILKWGGVLRGNCDRIAHHSPNLCSYLQYVKERLSIDMTSDAYYQKEIEITAGFSKIYSAYIKDFIIYDSRVAAALGLLVRTFCEQSGISTIPYELCFAWTVGRSSGVRNPSLGSLIFPQLKIYKPEDYLENNIRANWLVSAIADITTSKFSLIDRDNRPRAIEQALFMIGYDVSGFTIFTVH